MKKVHKRRCLLLYRPLLPVILAALSKGAFDIGPGKLHAGVPIDGDDDRLFLDQHLLSRDVECATLVGISLQSRLIHQTVEAPTAPAGVIVARFANASGASRKTPCTYLIEGLGITSVPGQKGLAMKVIEASWVQSKSA